MPDVSVIACADYTPEVCERALTEVLAPLGGLDWVRPGMRVVIKANLVAAMKPDAAATTHPALLTALTRLLKRRGASVVIGDSPGNRFTPAVLEHVYRVTGLAEAEAAGAELNRNFDQKEASFPEAFVARRFSYTAYLDDADAIISFCKLKSHGMMSLSAATKNLFGAVPGTTKPEYHFRYPDPLDFAGMIVDLNRYFKPRLYLVDAVTAMEGNGPTAGTPRRVGALLAGTDCHRLDRVCARLIGLDPIAVPTLQAARKFGLLDDTPDEIAGDLDALCVPDFKRIERGRGLQFETLLPGRLGRMFSGVARRALRSEPRLAKKECVGCGLCQTICPAHAIRIVNRRAVIDKKVCIRCFCCQEFCPKGAMRVHRPLPARLLNR